MPLYEYACADCNHRFEILQRIGESADGLRCPQCDADQLEKQFSTFAGTTTGKTQAAPAGACGGGSGFT